MSSRPPTAGSAPEQRGDNGNDVWQPTTVQGTLTPAHGHSASAYRGPATARGRQKALKKNNNKGDKWHIHRNNNRQKWICQ